MDFETPRNATRRVHVGKVAVGGRAPVSVQSMTNIPMIDGPDGHGLTLRATSRKSSAWPRPAARLVRVAIPNRASIARFGQVAEASPLPVVADVHFDYQIAVGACHEHAAGLRINPGNIGAMNKVDAVIEAAGRPAFPYASVSTQARSRMPLLRAVTSPKRRSSRSRPRASWSISANVISMTSSSRPRRMT